MSENRYFIDERTGCIAVRDRQATDPDYPGLHSDTAGVVWYEHGEPDNKKCSHCGNTRSYGWKLQHGARERAEEVLERMNNGDNT